MLGVNFLYLHFFQGTETSPGEMVVATAETGAAEEEEDIVGGRRNILTLGCGETGETVTGRGGEAGVLLVGESSGRLLQVTSYVRTNF